MANYDPSDLPAGYGGTDDEPDAAHPSGYEIEEEPRRRWFSRRDRFDDRPAGEPGDDWNVWPADEDAFDGQDADSIGPPAPRPSRRRLYVKWGLAGFAVLFLVTLAWLAIAAPISKTAEPLAPRPVTIADRDGVPVARKGAIIEDPVAIDTLPPHVVEAFLAIEDRRFYSHWGIDPRGIARAVWTNATSDGRSQGASTITQQLAKLTYLSSDRTLVRKGKEAIIAGWLELWLTKDQILERYLSNAYFGDNVYGLRAASLHYFYRKPENLTLTQAAMLAGMVKAPSRLAPTSNLDGAQAREEVVIAAMVDAGYLTPGEAADIEMASVDHRARSPLPRGGYFADWILSDARATLPTGYSAATVTTTLDADLQKLAERITRSAPLGGAQIALVAMRPTGEVLAMVGGKNYEKSPFNRAVQAKRQPGSTFKLAVYLAALRDGMEPGDMIDNSPIETGDYRPSNSNGRYSEQISLSDAFSQSSNVAAVRLYQQLGHDKVERAARDLGITGEIPANASVALGSGSTSLIELTSAFASIAANYGPVTAHGLPEQEAGFLARLTDGKSGFGGGVQRDLKSMLKAVVDNGTGRAAALSIPAFGKTGTTQDNRDALFVGFAGDLVVGVWIGNDDNSPLRGISGGGLPARIWRDFMAGAIPGAVPKPVPPPRREPDPDFDPFEIELPEFDFEPGMGRPRIVIDENGNPRLETEIDGMDVEVNRDGVVVRPNGDPPPGDQRPPQRQPQPIPPPQPVPRPPDGG